MKKLTISFALMALLLAGGAYAAETGTDATPPPAKAEKGRKGGHEGDKRPGPGGKPKPFEECDTNKDGFLSLDEFLACHPRADKARFEDMDANKDGRLSKEEMRAYREATRTERRTAEFKRCDTNGDNMLSLDEFLQCRPERQDRDGKGRPEGRSPK